MKKVYILLSSVILLAACKKNGGFLDNKTNNALNEASVFSDSIRTISFLTRIYDDAGFSFQRPRGTWENGSTEQATDDSEYSLMNTARKPRILYESNYSADNFPFFTEFWQTPWDDIRRVNLLLSHLPTTPLNPSTQKRVKAEARFFRAWYYHNLLINFGGVPIIKDQIYGAADVINPPRNTFSDCVDYIVKELDDAAKDLPASYDGNDYGRVTNGAALALKARMLLYAASPLFNGNTWPSPTSPDRAVLAGYPTYSVARWQTAADAAKAVMDLNRYSLVVDNSNPNRQGLGFYSMFLQRVNTEYIFFWNRLANKDMENFYLPKSRRNDGGTALGTPTQNIVDAFPMNNGKAITDPTSTYDPKNPYVNRDPRFNYSILYNGSMYFSVSANAQAPVFTYEGANPDGFVQNSSTSGPTGYYSRKMCDENLAQNSSGTTNRGWPLIRYADILMMYAEAINETGQTELAYPPLRLIRDRAGIKPGADNNYGMKIGMSVAEMRAFIQNERRIEFMYENQRWDDVRRWKIAMVTQNGYNRLMDATLNADKTTYTYRVVPSLFLHIFHENNYILPIPTSEIRKSPALIQNPGW